MRSRSAAALAAAVVALVPSSAAAISVANVGANASFSLTLGSCTCTTATTNLNAADWADNSGTATGWNGTVAVQQFTHTGAWAVTGHALSTTAAGAFTGTTHDAVYTVSVTSDGGTTVVVSWAGAETGSGTATKASAFAVGTKGLTITFATGTTYTNADKYVSKNDVLGTSALTMAGTGTCVAGTGAVNAPTWTNTAQPIVAGTPTAFGTALKFLTSATNTGTGAWTCTPKARLKVDPNTGLAVSYTATAQYTIVSGP